MVKRQLPHGSDLNSGGNGTPLVAAGSAIRHDTSNFKKTFDQREEHGKLPGKPFVQDPKIMINGIENLDEEIGQMAYNLSTPQLVEGAKT